MGLELKSLQDKLVLCKKEYETVRTRLEELEQQRMALTQRGLKLEGAMGILSEQVALLTKDSKVQVPPAEPIAGVENAQGIDKVIVEKK